MFTKEAFQEERPDPIAADGPETLERISGRDYREDAECRIDPDDHLQIERLALRVRVPGQPDGQKW
jgi:hypothetical protein